MYRIKLSDDAVGDLRAIENHISNELSDEKAAVNTISKITQNLRLLEQFPNSGAALSNIVNIETDYRFLVCGNYMAFYFIEHDNVMVSRILYGKRNFVKILFGDINET